MMKKIFGLASALVMAAALPLVQPALAQAIDSDAAIEAYKAVLQDKMTFYCTNAKKNYKLSEYDYWNDEEKLPLTVVRFAVIDMNGDGAPEVVLELTSGFDGAYEVLHYENDMVYGFNHSYRAINDLTSDGIYGGSSGAADGGYYKASIKKDTYKTEALGYSQTEADGSVSYYVGTSKVTESQYEEFQEKMWAHARQLPAAWMDFTDEEIAGIRW